MSLVYPLDFPDDTQAKGIRKITWRGYNNVGYNSSPFNLEESVFNWNAQLWQADITIAPQGRVAAEYWVGFLLGLHGRTGTFLLTDPTCPAPRGGVTSLTITGSTGATTVTATNDALIRAGDAFQLGSGAAARLYKVTKQKVAGTGNLEIWPALRADAAAAVAILNYPQCVFRLANNIVSWDVDEASLYGISFTAQEAMP